MAQFPATFQGLLDAITELRTNVNAAFLRRDDKIKGCLTNVRVVGTGLEVTDGSGQVTTFPLPGVTTNTTTTPPKGGASEWSVALIGDSMVAPDTPGGVKAITPAKITAMFETAGASKAVVVGRDGHPINNGTDWTTVGKIQEIRDSGFEPTVWCFQLGMNTEGMTVEQERAEVRKVLAKVDEVPGSKVAWGNWQSRYALDTYYAWGQTSGNFGADFNTMLAQEMAARGNQGKVVDVWTWLANNLMPYTDQGGDKVASEPGYSWFTGLDASGKIDLTHPTAAGAEAKYNFYIGEVKAYALAG